MCHLERSDVIFSQPLHTLQYSNSKYVLNNNSKYILNNNYKYVLNVSRKFQ